MQTPKRRCRSGISQYLPQMLNVVHAKSVKVAKVTELNVFRYALSTRLMFGCYAQRG